MREHLLRLAAHLILLTMNKPLPTLLAILASLAPLMAQQPQPATPPGGFKSIVEKIDLKDGDTLVFCGDSITHQCLYTQYVEDFFFTRFPKLHVRFHNAGVGGDRAQDTLLRFDDDIASFKPKYVTILLGMNDGSYRDFDKATFDTYQAGMTTLLDKITELGATAVPMTPTMFDSRAKKLRNDNAEPRNTHYNGVLALYGAWLREQALNRGLGYVDMWSPLDNLTLEQRRTNPNFTMIEDGVHPGHAGQTVMAVAIIHDMFPQHGPVSAITLNGDRDPAKAATALNGTISDLSVTPEKISFTFLADSLPWVLPPEAAEGVKLTQLGHKFSNEKLTVHTMPPGSYELKIDGQSAGTYTNAELESGVELEANEKTPQYQQALKVAMLNKERTEKAVHPLRDLWGARKGKRHSDERFITDHPDDPSTPEKKAALEKWLADFKATVTKLNDDVKKYDEQIYQANQPVARKYELARVP